MRKISLLILAFLISVPALNGCGSSDDIEGPSYTERMISLLTILKNSTVSYNELEKSDVKPYLEKAIINMDEAIGLIRSYQSDEEIPDEFLNEISAVVTRAAVSVDEAAMRSDVKDDRYELLEKALIYAADRLTY